MTEAHRRETVAIMRTLAFATAAILVVMTAPGTRAQERRMTPSQEVELAKMFEDLAKSHVEGNAPDAADFDTILRRDLTAYFAAKGVAEPSVEFEFLRQGATQSGVSYPKYYLWVRVLAKGASTRMAGAVRVAAIEKVRFDVTDFLSVEQVRSSPERVSQIFPAALAPSIISKAAAN